MRGCLLGPHQNNYDGVASSVTLCLSVRLSVVLSVRPQNVYILSVSPTLTLWILMCNVSNCCLCVFICLCVCQWVFWCLFHRVCQYVYTVSVSMHRSVCLLFMTLGVNMCQFPCAVVCLSARVFVCVSAFVYMCKGLSSVLCFGAFFLVFVLKYLYVSVCMHRCMCWCMHLKECNKMSIMVKNYAP